MTFTIIRELPGKQSENKNDCSKKRPSELRFKIEPIGIQPEDDDDLDTCPSRTRPNWPRQIIPWWKPSDRGEKPPYSYATLIAHAILSSKDGRLTLSDIYKWISEEYPFYKRGNKGWQNSIRHNLSLNKQWFIKLDRRPTQAHPGKGGYWTLMSMTERQFVENITQAGGHSRRHHDIIGTLRTAQDDDSYPNIHITRPEDYQVKKSKSTIPAPRMRHVPSTNTKTVPPKTDPKSFVIRFESELGKRGKKNKREASEDGMSKKSKTIKNDDDFWMHEPDLLMDTNPFFFENQGTTEHQAQNLLDGLQAPITLDNHPNMKTIDINYDSLEKSIHFPNPPSFLNDLNHFSVDDYIDLNEFDYDSSLLNHNEHYAPFNSYWPDNSNNFDYF